MLRHCTSPRGGGNNIPLNIKTPIFLPVGAFNGESGISGYAKYIDNGNGTATINATVTGGYYPGNTSVLFPLPGNVKSATVSSVQVNGSPANWNSESINSSQNGILSLLLYDPNYIVSQTTINITAVISNIQLNPNAH